MMRFSPGDFIDLAIAQVAPQLAVRRSAARTRLKADRIRRGFLSTFSAAEKNRLTNDWPTSNKSADDMMLDDLATINARARLSRINDWQGKSIIGAYERNVAGIGITPRANARDPETGKALEDFNADADKLFKRWYRRGKFSDIEGKKSGAEQQRLAISELVTVGESFAVMSYKRRPETVGLTIQMIEPEQLDDTLAKNSTTGNEVRRGIEVDEYNRAIAFWICTAKHPLENYSAKSTRIPADRVLHLMQNARVRQTHGFSLLAPVLRRMRHLQMYDEYELVAKRIESCIGGTVKTNGDFGDLSAGLTPETGDDGTDSNSNPEMILEPGMIHKLAPGEEFDLINPQRPGSIYGPFTERQIAQNAAGADLDFATVARDYSKGNFSSQRQGILECDKVYSPLQLLLIDQWLRPIYEEFITLAVMEGRLDAPKFYSSAEWTAEYLEADWQSPPKPWVDPAKQSVGAKIALENGLTTLQVEMNKLGLDWRDVLRQREDVASLAEELKVSLPWLLSKTTEKPPVDPHEPRPGKEPPSEPQENDSAEDGLQAEPDLITNAVLQEAVGPEIAAIIGD